MGLNVDVNKVFNQLPYLFSKGHSGTHKNSLLQVDQNCVRNSYDVFSLLR